MADTFTRIGNYNPNGTCALGGEGPVETLNVTSELFEDVPLCAACMMSLSRLHHLGGPTPTKGAGNGRQKLASKGRRTAQPDVPEAIPLFGVPAAAAVDAPADGDAGNGANPS